MEKREELNSLMEKYKEFTSIILKLDKENRKSLSTLDAEEAKNYGIIDCIGFPEELKEV